MSATLVKDHQTNIPLKFHQRCLYDLEGDLAFSTFSSGCLPMQFLWKDAQGKNYDLNKGMGGPVT